MLPEGLGYRGMREVIMQEGSMSFDTNPCPAVWPCISRGPPCCDGPGAHPRCFCKAGDFALLPKTSLHPFRELQEAPKTCVCVCVWGGVAGIVPLLPSDAEMTTFLGRFCHRETWTADQDCCKAESSPIVERPSACDVSLQLFVAEKRGLLRPSPPPPGPVNKGDPPNTS